jgi:hypothetical protein
MVVPTATVSFQTHRTPTDSTTDKKQISWWMNLPWNSVCDCSQLDKKTNKVRKQKGLWAAMWRHNASWWMAAIEEFAIWVVTDMVLSASLLKCCVAVGCWHDVKSDAERRHKPSSFADGNNAIVDGVVCVTCFAFWKMSAHKTDLWFHLASVQKNHFCHFPQWVKKGSYQLVQQEQIKSSAGQWLREASTKHWTH